MTMGERIRQIRKELRMSQAEFGKKILVSSQAVSFIENGVNNPKNQTISMICHEFHINETWLRTGLGKPRGSGERDAELEIGLNEILTAGPEDFRRKLISILVRLPQEKWNVLAEIADEMARWDEIPEATAGEIAAEQNQSITEITEDELAPESLHRRLDEEWAKEKRNLESQALLQNASETMTGAG